jgi:hypothetical protein
MPQRLVVAVALAWIALAAMPARADDSVDVSAYKDRLKVLTDGKGHLIALMPFTISDDEDQGLMFYSNDGKTFYAQRRIGGGRNGNESFDTTFWDPRVRDGWQRSFGAKDKKYALQCGDKNIEFQALPKPEADKLLGAAKFLRPRWKRQAYALARDNSGVYYYVDRAREPEGNKDFRVFKGPKGALKQQKMMNVVSDSEGDIFITKAGKLRLVLDKHETSWIEGKTATKLVEVSFDTPSTVPLIYRELGVYAGEMLGTPCDDVL